MDDPDRLEKGVVENAQHTTAATPTKASGSPITAPELHQNQPLSKDISKPSLSHRLKRNFATIKPTLALWPLLTQLLTKLRGTEATSSKPVYNGRNSITRKRKLIQLNSSRSIMPNVQQYIIVPRDTLNSRLSLIATKILCYIADLAFYKLAFFSTNKMN